MILGFFLKNVLYSGRLKRELQAVHVLVHTLFRSDHMESMQMLGPAQQLLYIYIWCWEILSTYIRWKMFSSEQLKCNPALWGPFGLTFHQCSNFDSPFCP